MKPIPFTVFGVRLMSNVERETLENVYPTLLVSLCLLDNLFFYESPVQLYSFGLLFIICNVLCQGQRFSFSPGPLLI